MPVEFEQKEGRKKTNLRTGSGFTFFLFDSYLAQSVKAFPDVGRSLEGRTLNVAQRLDPIPL
jgi:hypothetical protein